MKIDEINNVTIDNIPMNQPSICIPRTLPNITKEKVLEVFKHYNMGEIDKIDMIQRNNEKGERFQRIFIHFKQWYSNPIATKSREMLHIAMKKFKFSMRGMNKILKVARTIADLEQSINVNHFHLAEALSYRVKSIKYD